MKRLNKQKEIQKAVELVFCQYLALTRQSVTDAMNAGPCPLGSEKHFEATAKLIMKRLEMIDGQE